jgi:hypothetical protein
MLIFSVSVQAQAPGKQWDKRYGGTDRDRFSLAIPTKDGGYLLGGSSLSGIGGDKSEPNRGFQLFYEDYWIVKVSSNGTKEWDKTFGGEYWDILTAMVQTPDGGYLLGGYSQSFIEYDKEAPNKGETDYWLVKIDAFGNKQWDKTFGGLGGDDLNTMIVTSDGGYLLAGYSTSDSSGDKSDNRRANADYWIVKIDGNGNKQWDKTFGGDRMTTPHAVIQTADGGYLISGIAYSGAANEKTEPSRGENDAWLIKITSNGTKEWDKTLGGNSHDALTDLIPTSDGGYLLVGSTSSSIGGEVSEPSKGDRDGWLVKIASNGTKLWDTRYGGSASDGLGIILPTSDGGYLLGGYSQSDTGGDKSEESRGQSDGWLVKITSNGTKEWDKTFGGNEYDHIHSIIPTPDGQYLLGCSSNSDKSGDRSEGSRGWSDFWILKTGTSVTPSPSINIKINSAGPAVRNYVGESFEADRYVSGGFATEKVSGPIANTLDSSLYRDARQGGYFKYEFPTGNGIFKVKLHFSEPYYGYLVPGGVGSRKFKVRIEGVRKLTEYDVFAKAGGAMKAIVEHFTVQVMDSVLTIEFVRGSKGYSLVSAIEVVSFTPTTSAVAKLTLKEKTGFTTFRLSPNPATDRLWVSGDFTTNKVLFTQVIDLFGNTHLQNVHTLLANHKQLEIPINQLKSGFYLVRLKTIYGVQILKFIKQ